MIGLGKWEFNVNTFMYKGKATITIFDDNGKYGFSAEVPGMKQTPEYYISKVEEKGDTLSLTCGSDAFPNKEVNVFATFRGNTCTGYVKVPILGKVALNGTKMM